MKNNVSTIMSKEFTRFFTDRRLVVMTFMPAVLIYVVYSFMGTTMASVFAPDEGRTPKVFVVNMPDGVAQAARAFDISFIPVDVSEIETIKSEIADKSSTTEVLAVFPAAFDGLTDTYNTRVSATTAPNVELYFNSTVPNSNQTYYYMTALLDDYEASLANVFDINRGIEDADLATSEDMSATIIATIMPMLLMIFLVSGCIGLTLESITGEKERGTLATLLVSPLKRSELAAGKILSLAALSFLAGSATAIATIMSMPNLMGGSEVIDAGIYSTTDYALLAFVILSTLLVIVAMLSIISAFSRTVKEAGQATTPVMILVMVIGVSGMFGSSPAGPWLYMIPLYGSVQSMSGIFSISYDATNIIIACLGNLLYACVGGFALAKMFNSEKVMFSR